MNLLKNLIQFPRPLIKTFPLLWIIAFLSLAAADIVSKKMVTDHLRFHLSPQQYGINRPPDQATLDAQRKILVDRPGQVNVLGENGKYIKFRLVFNDRFAFSLGPSVPVLGIVINLLAVIFLFFYRAHNPALGHPLAWLFIFSGAIGNLIDKHFVKSLTTGDWIFSYLPVKGAVTGVVDFVECIWFGWDSGVSLLSFLSWKSWPTFNLADSLVTVGVALLLLTMRKYSSETQS